MSSRRKFRRRTSDAPWEYKFRHRCGNPGLISAEGEGGNTGSYRCGKVVGRGEQAVFYYIVVEVLSQLVAIFGTV